MPTPAEYATQPLEAQLKRIATTADDLAAAMKGRSEADLGRRPAVGAWAAKEIVCHLRDIEELAMLRFRMMLAMDEPKLIVAGEMPHTPEAWGLAPGDGPPVDPARWAEERQYLAGDTAVALTAFRRRREESLALFRRLTPVQWERGAIRPNGARMVFRSWPAALAGHDDNHLDQLRRALAGRA